MFVDLVDDPLDVGLGEDEQLGRRQRAQPRRAELGLAGAFLAGDVEDAGGRLSSELVSHL